MNSLLMRGKRVLITGATNGIGLETASALARMGAELVLVGRSEGKLAATADRLRQETPNAQLDSLCADLSEIEAVRGLADTFLQRYDRLDVLINNAGAFFNQRTQNSTGLEMTFALNHLAYYQLTLRLWDALRAAPAARVINVSSDAHRGQQLDFNDLEMSRNYRGFEAYGKSKLANILFTYEMDRRINGAYPTVNAMHPGFVATGFAKNNGLLFRIGMQLMQFMAKSPEEGASTAIYLASSPEVEGVSGKYFTNSQVIRSSSKSYDVESQRRLWEISAELTGIDLPVIAAA